MNPLVLLGGAVLFLALHPLIIFAVDYFQKSRQAGQKMPAGVVPEPSYKSKFNRRLSFAFKSYSKKTSLFIFLGGLALALVAALVLPLGPALGVAAVLSLVAYGVPVALSKKSYQKQQGVIAGVIEAKKKYMGLLDPKASRWTYSSEFTVRGWTPEDQLAAAVFNVPVTFDSAGRSKFLSGLSEGFGNGHYFAADEEAGGWDTLKNTVAVKLEQFQDEKEKAFITDFVQYKKKNLGATDQNSSTYTYYQEFTIDEKDEDGQPLKLTLSIPVGVGPDKATLFLDSMSTLFGRGRPWELDEEAGGWDIEGKQAHLSLEAPLPGMAMWSERFIEDPNVQWSFMPLGLASKWGVPITNPETGEVEHLVGYDVNGVQGKYMDKNGLVKFPDLMSSPHAILAGVTGGGKSVMQRNVILSCLMRPRDWLLCIVDMKKVEGAMWRKYGVPVATTYQDAEILLSWAQTTMMERFETMEKRGLNNWKDMPDDERGPAIMVNVDEVSELLAPVKGKTDEQKAQAEMQGNCQQALESIARLGRAAMVYMVIAGQRPDSEVVSMQIRQNCPTRLAAGALPGTIAQMVFEGDAVFASSLPSKPQGRCAMKIHSATPNKFQGFFADESWFDEYLAKKGLEENVYGSVLMKQEYENNKAEAEAERAAAGGTTATMTQSEAISEWDSELDDLISGNFDSEDDFEFSTVGEDE